jgi:hypothetical protein
MGSVISSQNLYFILTNVFERMTFIPSTVYREDLLVRCSYDNNNNNNNNNTWNVKARVIPVIIGASGTISKSCRKYVSNIPGNHDVRELQETAILGTAHILRKVLT